MSKIEEVARAIYADRNGSGCKPWGNLTNSHKAPYIRDALAAIRSLRDPEDGMNAAGMIVGDYPWDGKKASRVFTAMIDAILSEAGEKK